MSDSSNPFEGPKESSAARPATWPLVRFVARRALLLGVIPLAVGVVTASAFATPWAFLIGWAIPLLLWLPSSVLAAFATFAGTTDDPRAMRLTDGRLVGRSQYRVLIFTRAWEAMTSAMLMPLMASGVVQAGGGPVAGYVVALTLVPVVLLRWQWISFQIGRGAIALADEDYPRAVSLLEPVHASRLVGATAAVQVRLMLAQARCALGDLDGAQLALTGADHPILVYTRAEFALGRGDAGPAKHLMSEPRPSAGSHQLSWTLLSMVLSLYEQRTQDALDLAEDWQVELPSASPGNARYLDLLHALAHAQAEDFHTAGSVLTRRGAESEGFLPFANLHPRLDALRHQLLEGLGEDRNQARSKVGLDQ